MFSKRIEIIAVELTKGEIETLENARKIVGELIHLMKEIDNTDIRLLCENPFKQEEFTINDMEKTAYAISTICDAYRIES